MQPLLENLVEGLEESQNPRPNAEHPGETPLTREAAKKLQKKLYDQKYYQRNKPKKDAQCRQWQKDHPEQMLKWQKEWRQHNPEKAKAHSRRHAPNRAKWARDNQEKRKKIALDSYYRHRGPLKIRVLVNTPSAVDARKRRLVDVQFRLACRLRVILKRAIKRAWVEQSIRTMELIGCSVAEVRLHIEGQFTDGMTWLNTHIDHFVPVTAFDLRDLEEQKWCFNWRNLRPMFGPDNIRKSNKLPVPLPSWLPPHIATRILSRRSPTPPTPAPAVSV